MRRAPEGVRALCDASRACMVQVGAVHAGTDPSESDQPTNIIASGRESTLLMR